MKEQILVRELEKQKRNQERLDRQARINKERDERKQMEEERRQKEKERREREDERRKKNEESLRDTEIEQLQKLDQAIEDNSVGSNPMFDHIE